MPKLLSFVEIRDELSYSNPVPIRRILYRIRRPFPTMENGNRQVLVAVEHLTGWTIARATMDTIADSVIDFFAHDIMHYFGSPRYIVSGNATYFATEKLYAFFDAHGIELKTVKA